MDGSTSVQFYSSAGQILYSTIVGGSSGAGANGGSATRYVYLSQRLIAETKLVAGAATNSTRYIHTDGLGSPVAHSDAGGNVVDRSRYEAYGAKVNIAGSTNPVGLGFTGHVNDVDTGLVYMQQRYYDPVAGRFLSTDQVLTDTASGASFNRYAYANNNPYRYTDPDGRDVVVSLQAYKIGTAPIQGDYGHQYLHMRDTITGQEMISRAGPSAPFPGGASAVVSGSPVKAPSGDGNVTLKTELAPASKSTDSNPQTGQPLGSIIEGSKVTIGGSLDAAASKVGSFNNKVDASNIDYKPLSTNSNAYAGSAYTELTGKAAPTSKALPGSDVNLKENLKD